MCSIPIIVRSYFTNFIVDIIVIIHKYLIMKLIAMDNYKGFTIVVVASYMVVEYHLIKISQDNHILHFHFLISFIITVMDIKLKDYNNYVQFH